jgi:hypothetical protein
MASKRQLDHRAALVSLWRAKAIELGSGWRGYTELIEELHFIAAFVTAEQANVMIGAIHPVHSGVVEHYLTLYGAFDSPA